MLDGSRRKAKETAMIERQRPQYGDLVITKDADGFWTSRPSFLDGSHTLSKVDTLEAAVASGGLIACLEQVALPQNLWARMGSEGARVSVFWSDLAIFRLRGPETK